VLPCKFAIASLGWPSADKAVGQQPKRSKALSLGVEVLGMRTGSVKGVDMRDMKKIFHTQMYTAGRTGELYHGLRNDDLQIRETAKTSLEIGGTTLSRASVHCSAITSH
jgi:hypothetical protein